MFDTADLFFKDSGIVELVLVSGMRVRDKNGWDFVM